MKNKVELLSPVGSYDSLLASIENGADAVYLGGKLFNARQYATNLDDEELKSAVTYAHERGVKVYVVVNIILRDDELKEAIDYIAYLYNIDVDALIIQDLGLVRTIKNLIPDFEIHGSTQMSINNYMGAGFLDELGFTRVVLARELSVEEIKEINEKTDIELEIFIHGALCVSYSGQCLMSSMIGGRSGNRGTCAQPCRMKYTIVDTETNESLNRKFDEQHMLSLKDLNTIDDLEDIIDSGVTSLKVEGRMKKPEYVATIIEKYRKKIDSIELNEDYLFSQDEKDQMAQMFNRGFTKGFLKHDFGNDIVTLDKPNNRGVFIGEVSKIDQGFTYIRLKESGSLNVGDGIQLRLDDGREAGTIVSQLVMNKDIARIDKIRNVRPGDKVYKTLDVDLNKEARESFRAEDVDKKHPLYMEIDIDIDKPVVLKVIDQGRETIIKSKEVAELARKVSLNEDRVKEQMSKLGNTPYRLEDIKISIEENSMVRVSVLNDLRRSAVEELIKYRGNFNRREDIDRNVLKEKTKKLFTFEKKGKTKERKISVKVDNIGQFKDLDLDKLDRIYLNFKSELTNAIIEAKRYEKEIYLSTEKIVENKDFKKLKSLLDKVIDDIDGVSVNNLGTLKFVKDNYDTKIHADIGLNIFNSQAVKLLSENQVSTSTLSPELKLNQIEAIARNKILQTEVVGYGYLPTMVLKYCPMSVIKNCKSTDDCETCELKEGYGLLDRKDMVFEFKRTENSTVVYNSQPIVVPEHLNAIYNSHVDMVRLDFTIEDSKDIKEIQETYYDFANDYIDIEEVERRVDKLKTKEGITKGHFFRGVL